MIAAIVLSLASPASSYLTDRQDKLGEYARCGLAQVMSARSIEHYALSDLNNDVEVKCAKDREEAFEIVLELWLTRYGKRLSKKRAQEYILTQLQMQSLDIETDQVSLEKYQACLAPIVKKNEAAIGSSHQPLEAVLDQIKGQCSRERSAARDALARAVVASGHSIVRRPTEADKEELINDATIRWANNAVVQAVAEEK